MNAYLRWLSRNTPTIFWNDSAVPQQVAQAAADGAAGVTTNPVITANTLAACADHWQSALVELPHNLEGAALAMARTQVVAQGLAREFEPMYRQGQQGKGYVCAQVDPTRTHDRDYMVQAARQIQGWAPNIVVKLPATQAGVQAYRDCVAEGINVAGTLGFTVAQSLALGQAYQDGAAVARQRGIQPGLAIVVMMVGRLDDYLRDCAADNGIPLVEEDICQAGVACLKEAYRLFEQRGYEAYLMPAGLRGPHQIAEIAGARMIASIGPPIAKRLADFPQEQRIQHPVSPQVIERLSVLPEFARAYRAEGLATQEFIGYGVVNRTTTFFIERGWNALSTAATQKIG